MSQEKVVVSWSGGKDSALALQEVRRAGRYEVAALVTTCTEGYERISMHGVRCALLERQAQELGLPLKKVFISKGASNDEYERRMLDAFLEYRRVGITRAVFGDLFLEDIRRYRDRMLAAIGMEAIYPIWQRETRALAREFVRDGFRAVLVCVDPRALAPGFAGRTLDDALLDELPPQVDPCGENGEFHTFVYEAPLFRRAVACVRGEVVRRGDFYFADLLPVDPEASSSRPQGVRTKRCPECGAEFACGPKAGKARCWCDELPPLRPVPNPGRGCLCPDCLARAVRAGGAPQQGSSSTVRPASPGGEPAGR